MRLTLLSLPLLPLVPSQAVWNTGDGAKYAGEDYRHPNETITSAVVADGVVDLSTGEVHEDGLGKGVFQYCSKVETVRLPESLRNIGDFAFHYCEALVHVDISSGVNEIGKGAFHWCLSLETVTIPEGVVHLPDSIFNECKSLESVKLPSSLEVIGWDAFNFCRSLATVNFHDLKGLKTIFGYA